MLSASATLSAVLPAAVSAIATAPIAHQQKVLEGRLNWVSKLDSLCNHWIYDRVSNVSISTVNRVQENCLRELVRAKKLIRRAHARTRKMLLHGVLRLMLWPDRADSTGVLKEHRQWSGRNWKSIYMVRQQAVIYQNTFSAFTRTSEKVCNVADSTYLLSDSGVRPTCMYWNGV